MTLGDAQTFEDLFPDDLIGKLLDLIRVAWTKLVKIASSEIENRITEKLLKALLREKRSRGDLPFQIRREIWIDDEDEVEPNFRIDLAFIYGSAENIYFGFEAKRVNLVTAQGTTQPNASLYCQEGVKRYVDSKYASGLPAAGLLAYVMDSNCQVAIDAVETRLAIDVAELKLGLSPHLKNSALVPSCNEVRETYHALSTHQLRLYHLFLPI